MEQDPLDSLLDLEEDYYDEGYKLGGADGSHAGWVEGKLFGIEKGFEKALEMGRMHGKATVWKYRLSNAGLSTVNGKEQGEATAELAHALDTLPALKDAGRLATQIEQLFSTTNANQLSTANDDDSVSEFDDRLKRASAKIKIVSRVIGEPEKLTDNKPTQSNDNIEELSSLSVRR